MIRKTVSRVFAGAILAVCVSGFASAQGLVSDQRTFFTFSQPVALPGVTLPAGKYTFKLADSQANRHIVQVFNADGTKIYATLLAIPAERQAIPDQPEVVFRETPVNSPAAIDTWYYPGTKVGHSFMYSKADEAKWAKAKADNAKVTKGEVAPANMTFADTPPTPPALVDIERTPAAAPASAPAQAPAPVASSVRPDTAMADSSASTTNARSNRRELPHTASSLPAIAMLGGLTLFAGLALAIVRRRAAL
jgi:LPXTG-motif cell wall-anchored protein